MHTSSHQTASEKILVPRRFSPRWPPIHVNPVRDGQHQYVFELRGHRSSIAAIGIAIAITISLVAAVSSRALSGILAGMLWILIPAALVSWIVLLFSLTYRSILVLDTQGPVAVVTNELCGVRWSSHTTSSDVSVRIAKLTLVRSDKLVRSWEGFAVLVVGDNKVMYTILMSREYEVARKYVEQLPGDIRRLYSESEARFVGYY